jgi:hypothetical protein
VEGCRGRYFIVKHVQPFIPCINNRFVRTQDRIMGAPSGGVNKPLPPNLWVNLGSSIE